MPPAGGYAPPPIDYANRTNVVAIVAIILGFLFPLGGIVAGSVALAQVKRTGEKGRGLAITGIIAGSSIVVLSIVTGVMAGIAGYQTSRDDALWRPAVGDCLIEDRTRTAFVDCAELHDYEVYAEFDLSGDAFPGVDAVDEQAMSGCDASFADFIGVRYQESLLEVTYLPPSEESWASFGDRGVSCLVFDTAARTAGTLAGAAR